MNVSKKYVLALYISYVRKKRKHNQQYIIDSHILLNRDKIQIQNHCFTITFNLLNVQSQKHFI